MNISIVTPHYNDVQGLQSIYKCLKEQTVDNWEWIIVDDLSDSKIRKQIQDWHPSIKDEKVKLIIQSSKTNASICRNIGVDAALYNHIIFLDADDIIIRGIEISANHVKSIKEGYVYAKASLLHKGRTTQLWHIRITNEDDDLISFVKLTTLTLRK